MDYCEERLHPEAEKGICFFNKGLFFEAHEALEIAWRDTNPPARHLYQGLLQVGVACYHTKRGNYSGAIKVLERGMANLKTLPEVCFGLDIRRFCTETETIHTMIRNRQPGQQVAITIFPKIILFQGGEQNG